MFGDDDGFGIEEFGMALGLGEEIGLGIQEDAVADIVNEPEPLSLDENRELMGPKIKFKKDADLTSARMFERWVHKVIIGEIDPYDTDQSYSVDMFEDPM